MSGTGLAIGRATTITRYARAGRNGVILFVFRNKGPASLQADPPFGEKSLQEPYRQVRRRAAAGSSRLFSAGAIAVELGDYLLDRLLSLASSSRFH